MWRYAVDGKVAVGDKVSSFATGQSSDVIELGGTVYKLNPVYPQLESARFVNPSAPQK